MVHFTRVLEITFEDSIQAVKNAECYSGKDSSVSTPLTDYIFGWRN